MNKIAKKIAVTFVTALLICGMSVNSYAVVNYHDFDYWNSSYFVPAPQYPNQESLPYGADTLIYEVYMNSVFRMNNVSYNGISIYRFYIKKDLYTGTDVSAFNGSTTCFVGNNSGSYEAFVASTSTVYFQTIAYIPNVSGDTDYYSFSDISTGPYYKTKGDLTYNFKVISGSYSTTGANDKFLTGVCSNYSCLYGGRDLKALVESGKIISAPSDELPAYSQKWFLTSVNKAYPTSGDLGNMQNEKNNQIVVDKLDNIESNIVDGFDSVNDSLNQGVTEIKGAITQAVNDIVNAGSDMPTLDTDNSWMNDSLTKVNEWVSSLEEFRHQMDSAKEENAENMQNAKSFLSGFFEALPGGIIAVMTLGLVIIVVVKVIGR